MNKQSNIESTRLGDKDSHRDLTNGEKNTGRYLISSYQARKRVDQSQETNMVDKTMCDCPLTDRIDQYFAEKEKKSDRLSTNTEENLHRLQQITDDVKLLTRQLQSSIESNRNNNAHSSKLGKSILTFHSINLLLLSIDERLLGEICYQLERRILVLIFSSTKHLYGYSLRLLPILIENETNVDERRRYQRRWHQIETYLHQSHFDYSSHSILTFNCINQYGIYADYTWLTTHTDLLSNINELKNICYSMLTKSVQKMKKDFSILIDSLQLISKADGQPLFHW